jgi:hypothetical protein
MKRIGLIIAANALFLFHCAILAIIFFGFLVPSIWLVYMAVMSITLLLDIILGYCILSKWEFDIRKKLNPHLNYDYSFSSYYTYKLSRKRISEIFIERVGFFFLVSSLIINIAFRFFY